MRGRLVRHSQLVERVFVRGQAKRLPGFRGLAPFVEDRTRIVAHHLGGRILDHDGAGAFEIALHASQQVRFAVPGISGDDDAPARPHPVDEEPLDPAGNVKPLEILLRQRFRDRFPARRGKRAPQPGTVACNRRTIPRGVPLRSSARISHHLFSASPRGTKPSRGRAAMLGW